AQRAVGRPAPARGDRARPGERALDPARRRADREPRLGDGRGDHASVRGAAQRRPDDRPGHPGARHRGARAPPDPPARRADRARREDGTTIVKRYIRIAAVAAALALGVAACKQAESAPLYEKVPVERRDIVVAGVADGVLEPALTFTVKSKAWGEIVAMPVQT